MAAYRKISVTFWNDGFIQSLTPEGKYFYLFLMTNTKTTQCGIYEITIPQMVFETGYNEATVRKLIAQFEKTGKIKYSKDTSEIALKNWPKYNSSESPTVRALVAKELKLVKNPVLIQYVYSTDTAAQETETEEEAKAEEETKTKQKHKTASAEPLVLPFDSVEFSTVWGEWLQYRHEAKKKLTVSTAKKQLAMLGARPEKIAIAMINQSIQNGWQGIFEIKQDNGSGFNKSKQHLFGVVEGIAARYGKDGAGGKG